MLSIGNLEWDLVSRNLDSNKKYLPQPPTCFSYKVLQKRTTKKKTESKEEYNGIWKIRAELLEDKNPKLKEQKIENYYSYLLFQKNTLKHGTKEGTACPAPSFTASHSTVIPPPSPQLVFILCFY